jgi:pimeloyl-ACP methyl ester carboxylesterase
VARPSEISLLQRGDLALTVESWPGDDSKSTVVLLYGGGQTRHSWLRTAERLALRGWPVVALDPRGHGDSGWDPNEDYSLDAFAGDLTALLTTLSSAAILVGASLGGITSLIVAGEHPELVRGLVMVDVVIRPEPEGVRRIQDFMLANRDGFESLGQVADAIAAYNPIRRRPRNLDGLRKNVRQRANGRWYWDPAIVGIEDEPTRRMDPSYLEDVAARVQAPTLIVRGDQSDVVSDAGLADMLRHLTHAEVADVPQAGHMVAGDDNDVFGQVLEDFLDGIPQGPS